MKMGAERFEFDFSSVGSFECPCGRHYVNMADKERWIPAEEPPKKDYTAVFAVDKHDYYFAAVYDKERGYRTNDVGADVDNIVAYCLFNPYRPERRENDSKGF